MSTLFPDARTGTSSARSRRMASRSYPCTGEPSARTTRHHGTAPPCSAMTLPTPRPPHGPPPLPLPRRAAGAHPPPPPHGAAVQPHDTADHPRATAAEILGDVAVRHHLPRRDLFVHFLLCGTA